MFRDFIGLVAGVFAMSIVYTVLAILESKLFPIPVGMDAHDPASAAAILAALPLAAKLLMAGGWCASAFAGSAVAARMAERRLITAAIIGLLMMGGTWFTLPKAIYPQWMILAGTLLPLPLAWLATRIVPAYAPTPETGARWRGDQR